MELEDLLALLHSSNHALISSPTRSSPHRLIHLRTLLNFERAIFNGFVNSSSIVHRRPILRQGRISERRNALATGQTFGSEDDIPNNSNRRHLWTLRRFDLPVPAFSFNPGERFKGEREFTFFPFCRPHLLPPLIFKMKLLLSQVLGLLGLSSLATSSPIIQKEESSPLQRRAAYQLQSPKNSTSKSVQWDHYSVVLGGQSE